ncbi:hypothetical protein [Kineococcus sp. R86509]|uniref:hypothetical protein n=1 Tax=Kineococcus sp. R86509 TaxID=3093851 RepID=UPI0036D40DFB
MNLFLPRGSGQRWLLVLPVVLALLSAAVTLFVLHFSVEQAIRLSLWIFCPSLIVVSAEGQRRRRQARRKPALESR